MHAIRNRVAKVLEIGIFGGSSLYMWRDYFPNATIHGIDVSAVDLDKSDRIETHVGDQGDRLHLQTVLEKTGTDFDIIVDDGGHTMFQQQTSLGFLFPHVRPGGFYIVEDLHTSMGDRVDVYEDAKLVGYYETGVGDCSHTTYEIVHALMERAPLKSEFITESEHRYLTTMTDWVEMFDRDEDRRHMTCVIKKKKLTLMQRIARKILEKMLG